MKQSSKCPGCREIYGMRTPPEDPPCNEKCPERVLLPENEEAARIYMMTRGQVISIGDTVIDINHLALWAAIDRVGVNDPLRCFEMVTKVFYHMLNVEHRT